MKKGDLVKFNQKDPTSIKYFGTNSAVYMASKILTHEERDAWQEKHYSNIKKAKESGEDTFHISMNSSGESHLPPRSTSIPLPVNRVYVVQKARCRVMLSWGKPVGGMTKILDTKTGESVYIKRDMVDVVS